MKVPNITKEEFLEAIKDGMKEAILTMTDTGDGYSGPICLEPFLENIKDGVALGVKEFLWWKEKNKKL